MFTSSLQKLKKRFLADTSGNFAIMTAALLPVLLGFAGVGMELANIMQVKTDLQNTADSAVLAAATEARLKEGKATDEEIKQSAKAFIAGQLAKDLSEDELKELKNKSPITLSTSDNTRGTTYVITTTINYTLKVNPLLSFIGVKTIDLSATSTATSSVNKGAPLSMYLVLDRSGSMSSPSCSSRQCPSKMDSLKMAVSYLIDVLNKADSTHTEKGSELIRTAAVSYDDMTDFETSLAWGTNAIKQYVENLRPRGMTDATGAMTRAYHDLKKDTTSETRAHKKNGSFDRYIVFMTDGEMTGYGTADNVLDMCRKAKADGIKIFSVAFMAPDRGQALLKSCASGPEYYFQPDNMEQIVSAFGEIARKASGKLATLTN